MGPIVAHLMRNNINLQVHLVKPADCLDDPLSRLQQALSECELAHGIFHPLLEEFFPWIEPQVDAFATPSAAKFTLFFCREPHYGALSVDALWCSLD